MHHEDPLQGKPGCPTVGIEPAAGLQLAAPSGLASAWRKLASCAFPAQWGPIWWPVLAMAPQGLPSLCQACISLWLLLPNLASSPVPWQVLISINIWHPKLCFSFCFWRTQFITERHWVLYRSVVSSYGRFANTNMSNHNFTAPKTFTPLCKTPWRDS